MNSHLRELRLRTGLTMSQFAKEVGISQQTYWRAENGDPTVRDETIYRIAIALSRLLSREIGGAEIRQK